MEPVILTCAVTGAIHTPSMSPHLPVTPAAIRDEALAAARAGAAILHLHARDPETGRPSALAEDWTAFLPEIAAGCDAVINMTTGGSATMSLDDRLAGPAMARPEMCSLNMGSMNFALYPMIPRVKEWRFDWEKPQLEASEDGVFRNTPRDIAEVIRIMGDARGARFEFECYDTGHLDMLKHFVDRGAVSPPFFIQFVFGVLGGMAADPELLVFLKAKADRFFGADYRFSVLAAGRAQMAMAALSVSMGGHARVGLEDSLWIDRGALATSNAQQVERAAGIVASAGRRLATPDEARQMLRLKGRAATAF